MPTTSIILIVLTLVIALAVAGFQYLYKAKGSLRHQVIFFLLRFLSVWLILILLVNPKITRTEMITEKPDLVLAVDNSASIAHFEQGESVKEFVKQIQNDPRLQERFTIHTFGFGENLEDDPELRFDHQQTDIPQTLRGLNKLYSERPAPTVLITDGNQTIGEEMVYSAEQYDHPLIPVVVGDTTSFRDLRISRINANKYSYLGNRFPVEIMVNYAGKTPVKSKVQISSGDRVLSTQDFSMDVNQSSVFLQAEIPSNAVGVQTYTVAVSPLENEENVQNNTQSFAIEVIDERSKILLLYDLVHPDLGSIKKAIESNQQREVVLQRINQETVQVNDYQLIILYQPDAQFSEVMEAVSEASRNMLIITGPETDWNFLNTSQNSIEQEPSGQTEEYLPEFNPDFDLFQVGDVGFGDFPPLIGAFGDLETRDGNHTLLFRKIQDIETQEPMLAFWNEKTARTGWLLGSGIWSWRSHVFREEGSFESFDTFFNKVVQFLASQQNRNRFEISYEPFYQGNSDVQITAEYFDQNYVFDPGAEVVLDLKEMNSQETRTIPFVRRANQYLVNLDHLPPAEYTFTARVKGEGLARSGSFTLSSFEVEKQFSRANLESLRQVATSKKQGLFFVEDPESLKETLLNSNNYLPIQKKRENTVPLVDWYYLLGILILTLSAEWFLRKYHGFI